MTECSHLIFIAEDDPDDQDLLAIAFSRVDPGLRIKIVNDGKEAVDFLNDPDNTEIPCLILLDYNMPELNGAQVIHYLSANKKLNNTPKIILSTSDNPLYIRDSISSGATEYRVKPDNLQKLLLIAEEMASICKNYQGRNDLKN